MLTIQICLTVHYYMIIIKVNNLARLYENCVVMLERLDKEIYFKGMN